MQSMQLRLIVIDLTNISIIFVSINLNCHRASTLAPVVSYFITDRVVSQSWPQRCQIG